MEILLNILYTIFILIIDFVIFSKLTKAYRIEQKQFLITLALLLVMGGLHSGFFHLGFLMPAKEFWDILMFSFALVILHYMTTFQTIFIKKFQAGNNQAATVSGVMLKIYDVMRFKIIYGMIFLYQVLAIWIPAVR